jgi:hypothetical protein
MIKVRSKSPPDLIASVLMQKGRSGQKEADDGVFQKEAVAKKMVVQFKNFVFWRKPARRQGVIFSKTRRNFLNSSCACECV